MLTRVSNGGEPKSNILDALRSVGENLSEEFNEVILSGRLSQVLGNTLFFKLAGFEELFVVSGEHEDWNLFHFLGDALFFEPAEHS